MLLKINAAAPEHEKIKIAAGCIRKGELVIFPTETVYGIGANALDEDACKKIFKAKGRPADNPLIIHVASVEMAESVGYIPKRYVETLKKVWPCPLTVIVKSKNLVSKAACAGLDTVAVRMPDNNIALELIKESRMPIAAPSANMSGRPSITEGIAAVEEFPNELVLDGGQCNLGLESSVLDLRTFRILRPGPFTQDDILKSFGRECHIYGQRKIRKPISPGLKYRHYSPETKLYLYKGDKLDLIRLLNSENKEICFIGSDETCSRLINPLVKKINLGSIKAPEVIAKNLFSAIRHVDELNVPFAVAESFEEKGIGLAIMNRLEKASSGIYSLDHR
ncbi:L-threonylcarbamoyladenylate synthase [Candidatus Parvarchaeota archaeon]|nr:L-threonylcarbamoyladenylate synthase [Candidatus Parvarchaeota archaeon]